MKRRFIRTERRFEKSETEPEKTLLTEGYANTRIFHTFAGFKIFN